MSLRDLPRPFFVLAPMDDVTDTVFRRVVAECAPPDVFFTEFVNADGLQSPGRPQLIKKLRHTSAERPLVAQIWGLKPESFRRTAWELQRAGFAGIDINMGCPDKTVVKNGACSALINNRPLAAEIIQAVREGAGNLPVSVKTRLGFNEVDLGWHEFLLNQRIDMLSVHGRTRRQMSLVPADWDMIAAVRRLRDRIAPHTLIVGNGDVASRAEGLDLARRHRLDGIMIGRGVFADPFVFAAASPWPDYSRDERLKLFAKHVRLFAETWTNGEKPVHILNKFCKIYVSGFDGAKELRAELMSAGSVAELEARLKAVDRLAV